MGAGFHGGFGNTHSSNTINGYPKTVHDGRQGKHIPTHNNYQKGRSIFSGSKTKAQELVNNYAGSSKWIGKNKERVDFGQNIGSYVDPKTGIAHKTTVGIIHYFKDGTHIVSAEPKNWRRK